MSDPYYADERMQLHHGNVLDGIPLADKSVDCVVTSPPYYGLRDYGVDGQIGTEATPAEYVEHLREVFAEVRRVLADDGTLWLNLGDSYSNASPGGKQGVSGQRAGRTFTATGSGGSTALPAKNLMGMPWRVAFALQADGWVLRNAVIWSKPNAMPESVTDRLSTRYELLFMFSKSRKYWFDLDPIRKAQKESVRAHGERYGDSYDKSYAPPGVTHTGTASSLRRPAPAAGANPGDVWIIATNPFPAAHFATFPPELPRRCIVSGCKPGGTVLDPFHGSGTTGMVALQNERKYVGVELSREYLDLSLTTRLAPFITNTDTTEAS